MPNLGFTSLISAEVLPIGAISSSYYLRLGVIDRAGVMADVSTILSNHGVSIEVLVQKDARLRDAQIVIVTNEVLESEMNRVITELESLDAVTSAVSRIRVSAF